MTEFAVSASRFLHRILGRQEVCRTAKNRSRNSQCRLPQRVDLNSIFREQRACQQKFPEQGNRIAVFWNVCLLTVCLFFLNDSAKIGLASEAFQTQAEIERRYFSGLRERRLYELLELLCQQKLNQENLPDSERRFYQLELARTLSLHAQGVSLAEASELWQQAALVLSRFPADDPLTQIEKSLQQTSRAEQLYWLCLANPENSELVELFFQQGEQAVSGLSHAETLAAQKTSARPDDDARQINERLEELRLAVVRTRLRMAELSPENSAQKTAHLQASQEQLPAIIRRNVRRRWEDEARLLEMIQARLKADESTLRSLFRSQSRQELSAEYRHRVVAEYARHLLAKRQGADTADLILKSAQQIGSISPELEAIRLQALLQMSIAVREKGDYQLADELEQEVHYRLPRLEQRGETYQAYIVRNFQQQLLLERQLGAEIAKTVAGARRASSVLDYQSSQKQYEKAIRLAIEQGKLSQILPIAEEAVSVDNQIPDLAHSLTLLRELWQASPHLEGMEKIHLLWCRTLGRDYLENRDSSRLARYTSALQEHLSQYREKSTHAEALWLLAELQFARIQVTAALELYRQIPHESSLGIAAQLREGQCYQWIIERVQSLKQSAQAWREQSVGFAQRVFQRYHNLPVTSSDQADLILLAGRFLLENNQKDDRLFPLTSAVLESSRQHLEGQELLPEERQKWRQTEQAGLALHSIALSQEGKVREAEQLLLSREAEKPTPLETLFLARQLAATSPTQTELKVALAELILKLTEGLAKRISAGEEILTPEEVIGMQTLRAESFLETGRITPAIGLYEWLFEKNPANRELLLRLAALYEECANAACHEKAYQLWNKQVQREKQGSSPWLEARYHTAFWASQSGRASEARKIVQMTRLLYPDMGSEQLQKDYRQLESDLAQPK